MNNSKAKRILAIVGVVLLLGLYISALVLAFIHNAFAQKMLILALAGTIFIPVVLYLIMMFGRLNKKNDPNEDSKNEQK